MGKYKKLVRDRIPEIIRSHGEKPITRKLGVKEYKQELLKKLVEEAQEVQSAASREEAVRELGDVQEVMLAMYSVFGIRCEEVTRMARKRRTERGAFTKRIYLEGVK